MLTKEEIGTRIRQYRIQKGKSQAELGEVLGHTHAAISDIEKGKSNVNATDISKIAEFLEVPLTELLKEQTIPTSYIQARDSKNTTSLDKKELEASGDAFIKHVRELAEKERNKE